MATLSAFAIIRNEIKNNNYKYIVLSDNDCSCLELINKQNKSDTKKLFQLLTV